MTSSSTHRFFQRLAARPVFVILIFSIFCALPGTFSLPVLDRDEARFAQASAQMIESGDYVRIQYQDTARNKKPAGIHWLQSLSVSTLSSVEKREIWAYRLPSVLSAILAALLTYWAGTTLFNRQTALLGALFLAASVTFISEALFAKTDAALLASICAMQGALARVYLASRAGKTKSLNFAPLVFWFALAASILIKGPIGPAVAVTTIFTLSLFRPRPDWFQILKPALGLIILILTISPWAIAIWFATDGEFFREAFSVDMFGKITQAQESHGAPPGYYIALVWISFWPASLFLAPSLRQALSNRAEPAILFCLAWIIPVWLIFEFSSTKLPHYVLPTYPALALLTAHFVLSPPASLTKVDRYVRRIGAGMSVFGLLTVLGLLVYGSIMFGDKSLIPFVILASLMIGGVFSYAASLAWSRSENFLKASLLACLASASLATIVLQGIFPNWKEMDVSRNISHMLVDLGAHGRLSPNAPPIAITGYHEPSIVFNLGTETFLTSPQGAAQYISSFPSRIAIVEKRFEPLFWETLQQLETEAHSIGEVRGFNYSVGRWVILNLYSQSQPDD